MATLASTADAEAFVCVAPSFPLLNSRSSFSLALEPETLSRSKSRYLLSLTAVVWTDAAHCAVQARSSEHRNCAEQRFSVYG